MTNTPAEAVNSFPHNRHVATAGESKPRGPFTLDGKEICRLFNDGV